MINQGAIRSTLELALDALTPHKSTNLRWYTKADASIDAINSLLRDLTKESGPSQENLDVEWGKFKVDFKSANWSTSESTNYRIMFDNGFRAAILSDLP